MLFLAIHTAIDLRADEAAPLRLVGSADGREFTHIESLKGELVSVSDGKAAVVPRGTRWRLDGELAGHESELYFAPPFWIVTRPNHPIRADQRMRTFAVVRLLLDWPWDDVSDYTRAVVVVLWLVDGDVTRVVPIASNTQSGLSGAVKALAAFELGLHEQRGCPVVMLLRDGQWSRAERWFPDARAEAVFARLHLDSDVDVAAGLEGVKRRGLFTRLVDEPLLYMVARCGFARAIPDVLAVDSPAARTTNRDTPLHAAAQAGYRDVAQALLAGGAKLGPLDNLRQTPFDLGIQSGHIELVCDLLGDRPSLDNLRGAVRLALDLGDTQSLRRLMAVGGDRVIKGLHPRDFGRTLEIGDPELVHDLIRLGMRLNDERPLLHATAGGSAAVVQLLLDAGARVDRTTPDGTSAAHIAAARGSVAVLKALHRAGADLDQANSFGESPLGIASRAGHTEAVAFIAGCGARVDSVADRVPGRDPKTRWITDCLRPESEPIFDELDVETPPSVESRASVDLDHYAKTKSVSVPTSRPAVLPISGQIVPVTKLERVPTLNPVTWGSAWAVASMVVETDGSVSHAFVVAADSESTWLAVDKIVDQYRFEPAERDGRKVRTRVTLPILFD